MGGGEAGHVRTGLGHDHLGNLLPDPGDGLEQVELVLPRPAGLGDHGVQLGDRAVDVIEPVQESGDQPGVVGVEVSGQRLGQLRNLDPHPALGHLREHPRVAFAGDHRRQHRPR